jgi:FkbM family methyltransferase
MVQVPSKPSPTAIELEALLGESEQKVIQREREAFDRLAGEFAEAIVLVGARDLGRHVLKHLRQAGIEPLAFADIDPLLWGKEVDGVMVMPTPDAAVRYRNKAVFVNTFIGSGMIEPMLSIQKQLASYGVHRTAVFPHLFWKYSELFPVPYFNLDLPSRALAEAESIRAAYNLMADEASRREFLGQLRWRLHLDPSGLGRPVGHEIYFADDLYTTSSDEVFIDCGAYDGDTLRTILRRRGSLFGQVVSFEPDPTSFARLKDFVEALPERIARKMIVRPEAVGARTETVYFDAQGTHGSSINGSGQLPVPCVSLDDALKGIVPTHVKMDLEGAELDALAGARQVIAEHAPILTISAYHRQEHLWQVPLLIRSFSDRYRFYLRPHQFAFWDYILYAVPTDRLENLPEKA